MYTELMKFDISAVILTMGDRPEALKDSINSIRMQQDNDVEVIVVWNGISPDQSIDAEIHIHSDVNVGIPSGRNLGASKASRGLILFLDDDARLLDPELLNKVQETFDVDKSIAITSLHIIDEDGLTARRHIPRLGSKSGAISGEATSFLGGACVARKSAGIK